MLVEPASLCWLAGRKAETRDGATWATELERWSALTAVVRDGGTGLSKGIELVRARRREQEGADLEDGLDVFHTLREGGRALRATWAEASRALERAEAAQQRFDQRGRQGQSNSGFGAPLRRLWAAAERAFARAEAAEAAWGRARSALELFTPEGRLNDRHRAEAVVTAAMPDLVGASWAKVRRLLSRPESFTFLDQAGHTGWRRWAWSRTSWRRCWIWRACGGSPGGRKGRRPRPRRRGAWPWPGWCSWRRHPPGGGIRRRR